MVVVERIPALTRAGDPNDPGPWRQRWQSGARVMGQRASGHAAVIFISGRSWDSPNCAAWPSRMRAQA